VTISDTWIFGISAMVHAPASAKLLAARAASIGRAASVGPAARVRTIADGIASMVLPIKPSRELRWVSASTTGRRKKAITTSTARK
jgi:hypothetical protein